MRTVSSEFLTAVRESHTAVTRVDVLAYGTTVATVDTVTAGTVTLDQTATARGRCDISLVDDGTLIPLTAADVLAPYGNEIRVSRGIRLPGGDELVTLGVFRLDDVSVDDGPEHLTIQIAGADRSARVTDARFEAPYEIAAGTNYITAIWQTIEAAVPGLVYIFPVISRSTPKLVAAEGDDRWQFCRDMAKSLGMDLYFNGDGACVLRPVSTPAGDAVYTIAEGAGGMLLQASRRWTRQGAFNRVIATGENTGEAAPARGVATDADPASPTYYYGAFGRAPRFYSSPLITTNDQAADAAASLLAREIGTSQSVDFGAVVNPALEPDDIIEITRQRTGIAERHCIDQITIGLSADAAMSATTRAVVGVF